MDGELDSVVGTAPGDTATGDSNAAGQSGIVCAIAGDACGRCHGGANFIGWRAVGLGVGGGIKERSMVRVEWLPAVGGVGAAFVCVSVGGAQKASPAVAAAKEVALSVDAGQCKAHYEVDTTVHTVHGTFSVKSGNVQFDTQSGKAGGLIVVSATSGDSGNSSRDEKMHKEVLESWKFGEATFRPT